MKVSIDNPWARAWHDNHSPRVDMPPSQWAAENVYLSNSPLGAKYQAGGHCDAILDDLADPDIYETSVVGHTGMGKSAVLEAASCWIVSQAAGPTLLIGQTDDTTVDWMETRMKPAFKKCEETSRLLPRGVDRHKNRKDAIIFPSMEYLTGGANLTNTQEKSMRYTLGDEPWMWKHGILGELLKRHHDRWNRKNMLCAQGGHEGSDWHTHTKDGQGFDRGFVCVECGHEQVFQWAGVKYEKAQDGNGDWDWPAIFETVRYECQNEHCGHAFPDTASGRKQLTSQSLYIPRGNAHIPGRRTRYVPAMANPRIQLSSLVREWIQAEDAWKNGDKTPRAQFIMKRLAQFWIDTPEVPTLNNGGDPYSKTTYNDGEKWEDEDARLMCVDVQKVGFWVVIRAWQIGTTRSRLIWEGKADTWQNLFDLQERFGLEHRDIFIDGRFSIDEIVRQLDNHCGGTANHWNILMGHDSIDGYAFEVGTLKRPKRVRRIYSKYQRGQTSDGRQYRTISFSNLRSKDALAAIMERKGGVFGTPTDVSKNYIAQMQSETKREISPGRWKWEKIKKHYHNHMWDCEVMGMVGCAIRGILKLDAADSP